MKRSPILSMEEAIRNFFEENPDFHEKIVERKAMLIVEKYFDSLKKYISSIFIKEGTLYIRVNTSNMRNYILIEREQIIEHINKELGIYLLSELVIN